MLTDWQLGPCFAIANPKRRSDPSPAVGQGSDGKGPPYGPRAGTGVGDQARARTTGATATVTDTVPRLLGRPAISFQQFARDHRAAFIA